MNQAPRVNIGRIKKITAERNIDLRYTYTYIYHEIVSWAGLQKFFDIC